MAGRPFATHTSLGQAMLDAGVNATEVCQATGVYGRTLTEYLSGRKPIQDHHLMLLADCLDVPVDDLLKETVDKVG